VGKELVVLLPGVLSHPLVLVGDRPMLVLAHATVDSCPAAARCARGHKDVDGGGVVCGVYASAGIGRRSVAVAGARG
jgi:hypothetical protein